MADTASPSDNSMDLNGIVNGVASQFGTSIQQSITDMLNQFTTAQNATSNISSDAAKVGQANAEIATMEGAVKANVNAQNADTFARMGIDPTKSNFVVGAMADAINENSKGLLQRDQQITQDRNIMPWNDPVGYLGAQARLLFEEPAQQSQQDTFDKQMLRLHELTQAATDTGIRNSQITVVDAAKEAANKATIAQATADVEGQKANVQLAQLGLTTTKAISEMNYQQLSAYFQQQQLGIAEADLKLKQLITPIEASYYSARMQEINEIFKEKQQNDAAKAKELTDVNTALAPYNIPPVQSVDQLNRMPAPIKEKLWLLAYGASNNTLDPASAMRITNGLNAPGNVNLNVTRQHLNAWSNDNMNNFNALAMQSFNKSFSALDDKSQDAIIDRSLAPALSNEMHNISPKNYFYTPPSLASVINQDTTPLLNEALHPVIAADKTMPLSTDAVFNAAYRVMDKVPAGQAQAIFGQLTQEMSHLFMQATLQANETSQYKLMGLPEQQGYHVNIHNPGRLGTNNYDMTNTAQVSNAFMRYLIQVQRMNINTGASK